MTAAALALLLLPAAHAGIVRAPVEVSGLALGGTGSAAASFAPPMPVLPPYLSVANPADGVLIADILNAAKASPTAAVVLAQVAQVSAQRGRPVVVEIVDMPEGGTYNLDWGILSLRRRDMQDGALSNASTLIHELQHLLQTSLDVPSDLLETELEAYILDFRVAKELGFKPPRGTYDARAQAALKRGVDPFLKFLRKNYPEDALLHKTRSRDYEARLRGELAESNQKLENLHVERAERMRVLDQMRELGHPEPELRNYRRDSVDPIDAAIDSVKRAIAYAVDDIRIFTDPAALAKARAYSRSVIRRARAFQKTYAGR